MLSLAVKHNFDVNHLDVVTWAYLYRDLEEEIFMKQPEDFVIQGQREKVCKLKKALYDLKHGGYAWNKKLNATHQDEFCTFQGRSRSLHQEEK